MTQNRSTRKPILWVVTGVAAIAGVFALIIAISAAQASPNIEHQEAPHEEEKDAPKPNEIEFRTGIPMLMAFENEKIESLYYHEIAEGQYDFLDRTVHKGAAIISNSEMDDYFNTFSEKGYRFAIASKDGETKYYRIIYFEPPLSLKNHYVYTLLYAPSDAITDKVVVQAKSLPAADKSYLSGTIANPYSWTPIQEESAIALQALLASQGKTFNISTQNGSETVRIMYVGPFSEELNMPEFQAMYNVTTSAGGQ